MKTNKYWLLYLAGGLALVSGATQWAFVVIHKKQAKAETEFLECAIQTLEGEGGIVLD